MSEELCNAKHMSKGPCTLLYGHDCEHVYANAANELSPRMKRLAEVLSGQGPHIEHTQCGDVHQWIIHEPQLVHAGWDAVTLRNGTLDICLYGNKLTDKQGNALHVALGMALAVMAVKRG